MTGTADLPCYTASDVDGSGERRDGPGTGGTHPAAWTRSSKRSVDTIGDFFANPIVQLAIQLPFASTSSSCGSRRPTGHSATCSSGPRTRSCPYLAAALIILFTPVLFVFAVIVYKIVRPHEKIGEVYERNLAEEALLAEVETIKTLPDLRSARQRGMDHLPDLPDPAQPRVRQLQPPRRARLVAVRLVRQGLRASRRRRRRADRDRDADSRSTPRATAAAVAAATAASARRRPAGPRAPRAARRRFAAPSVPSPQNPSSAPGSYPEPERPDPGQPDRAGRWRARPRPTARAGLTGPTGSVAPARPPAVPRLSTFSLEGRAGPGAVPRRLGRDPSSASRSCSSAPAPARARALAVPGRRRRARPRADRRRRVAGHRARAAGSTCRTAARRRSSSSSRRSR